MEALVYLDLDPLCVGLSDTCAPYGALSPTGARKVGAGEGFSPGSLTPQLASVNAELRGN